jgi:hypothetical protein
MPPVNASLYTRHYAEGVVGQWFIHEIERKRYLEKQEIAERNESRIHQLIRQRQYQLRDLRQTAEMGHREV